MLVGVGIRQFRVFVIFMIVLRSFMTVFVLFIVT
jgi:hypothetical protein